MQKRNKIFLVLFLAGMLACLPGERKASGQAPAGASLRPSVTEYKAEELRDPFKGKEGQFKKPEVVPQVQVQRRPLPPLAVQGLVWGGNFPQAIINDKVLKIGDAIEEARIIDISKSGVKVFFDDQEYDLVAPAGIKFSNSKQDLQEGGRDEK